MLVSDIGPHDAKIILIGEAPGQQEEKHGLPFVGASGKLLKQMLSHSGINYNNCYVTNVVNTRPPGNKFIHFYQDKSRKVPSKLLADSWHTLQEKIKRIKPNIVICLGAEPFRAVTNKRGVEAWRGSIVMFSGIKVICTYHPAAVLRNYSFHPIVEIDFAKANRESQHSTFIVPEVDMILGPSLVDVTKWFDDFDEYPVASFDLELVGRRVRCISFTKGSPQKPKCIVVPFMKFPSSSMVQPSTSTIISIAPQSASASSYWTKGEEVIVVEKLAKFFSDVSIKKMGQNSIGFDQPILEQEFGFVINNHYLDTMHAWHCLYPELPKSLDFLCSVLTDYPNYWSEKVTEDDRSEWKYCGMDSAATLEAGFKIEKESRDSGLWDLYCNHMHPLVFALSRAQQRGVLVDKEVREELANKQEKLLESLGTKIEEIAGKKININSPKQLKTLLYDEMKFPTVYGKTGTISTDEESIRKLEKKYPSEKIFNLIVGYRKASKLLSTFLRAELDSDGRIRTSYNASGTKNFRISSSKSIWGTGLNLQNIPVGKSRGIENIRHLFIAGEGSMFVKGDLSQAETRVVAEILYREGDPTLHEKYKDKNFDIHTWIAPEIFGGNESSVTKHQRDVGKLSNHSGNYGAGPRVLQTKALKDGIEGVSYEMSKRILDARLRAIPGLRKWWGSVERKLRACRALTTCFGRRRIFFGRLDEATFRDAYAFEPQSTVADVCNTIFRVLDDVLETSCRCILQVHDEVVVECPEDRVDYVVNEMRKAAIIPLWINEVPLIIPIDISIGRNWRDCSEYNK